MSMTGRMVAAQVVVVIFFAFFSVATFYKVSFPANETNITIKQTPMTFTSNFTCADGTSGTFTISSNAGESAEAFGVRARAAFIAFKAAFCNR